jgi:hypothetical protein
MPCNAHGMNGNNQLSKPTTNNQSTTNQQPNTRRRLKRPRPARPCREVTIPWTFSEAPDFSPSPRTFFEALDFFPSL